MALSLLTPKQQYLGSMIDSTMKTTTPSSLVKPTYANAPTSPIVSSTPSATSPVPPADTTPKSQYLASSINSTNPSSTNLGSTNPNPGAISGKVTTPSGAVVDSGTGALISGPPGGTTGSSGTDAYKAAFDAYIASLTPSSEETAATKYLNDLVLQSKRDQEEALNRGETLGFASGEAARVNKNNAFQIDAATNAVNALTTRRAAMTDAQKARLDFEKSLLPDQGGFSVSPGEDRYQYDPATRTYKKVASGEAKPPGTSITEAGGRRLLINDSTGATIRDLGPATSSTGTADERKGAQFGKVNTLLSGGYNTPNGEPYVDTNGFLTPQGFKTLTAAAKESGISRKEFLDEYAGYLYQGDKGDYAGYGLTAAELKTLRGY